MSDHDPDRERDARDAAVSKSDGPPPDSGAEAESAGSTIGTQLDEGLPFERAPIEPESPDPENALFVVLGALGTVALLASALAPSLL
ncbi:MAG: hypothetical protein ABEJ97_07125 [Halobellus sp.]